MKFSTTDKTLYLWLTKKLYEDLKVSISKREHEGITPKLKLAPAAYLINLVVYGINTKKDKYEDNFFPICSAANKNIMNFSKYMDFLEKEGFLIKSEKNYSTATKKCKKYRLASPYHKHIVQLSKVKGDIRFVNKRLEFQQKRELVATNKTQHLTKWLRPEKFRIEYREAIDFVRNEYVHDLDKRNKRILCIESIDKGSWTFSREGKDNRLHSVLTNLPKDIRQFVKYENSPLASLDLKNSQPYILSALLTHMVTKKGTLLNNYLQEKDIVPNMFDSFDYPLFSNDLERFSSSVISGEFYEDFGHVLWEEGVLLKDCCSTFGYSLSSKNGSKMQWFKGQRNATKDIVMRILFSSMYYNAKFVNVFKETYPTVYRLMNCVKAIKEKESNFLPILLQNIEANCILDHCTSKIDKDFPDIPLFTIHDSIVTTSENLQIIEDELENYLTGYFHLPPKLSVEYWFNHLDRTA
ncbi:MAG: hypothetical protein AAFN93_24230 [Bacteroidota bacterium]